jgi:hypothetical protein
LVDEGLKTCPNASTSSACSSSGRARSSSAKACEFDYSGAQACKALREEGISVVLVNSNPATIMTDPEVADRTYIEPVTPEVIEKIIIAEHERATPIDSLLPTLGGQTGLNCAMAAHASGVLEPPSSLALCSPRRPLSRLTSTQGGGKVAPIGGEYLAFL